MKLTRDEMIDNVCRKLGFEHRDTIWFCRLCEENPSAPFNDALIEQSYTLIMKDTPFYFE